MLVTCPTEKALLNQQPATTGDIPGPNVRTRNENGIKVGPKS